MDVLLMKKNNFIRPILFVCGSYLVVSFKYCPLENINKLIMVFLLLLIFYIIDVLFPSFTIYETIME